MNNRLGIVICVCVILVAQVGCGTAQPPQQEEEATAGNLALESTAFEAGSSIPERYSCDGDDLSPPLSWSELPSGTESLVLIFDDPDAPVGTWVHWVLFNVPASARSFPEDLPETEVVAGVGVHGSNSWSTVGYGGPCPPPGSTHTYMFRLYALDTMLDLDPGASRQDVDGAMQGHILASGSLLGTYGR